MQKYLFLAIFFEFELYVSAHSAQDDNFYFYLVPSSDKTAEKIILVENSHINDRLYVLKRIFLSLELSIVLILHTMKELSSSYNSTTVLITLCIILMMRK